MIPTHAWPDLLQGCRALEILPCSVPALGSCDKVKLIPARTEGLRGRMQGCMWACNPDCSQSSTALQIQGFTTGLHQCTDVQATI